MALLAACPLPPSSHVQLYLNPAQFLPLVCNFHHLKVSRDHQDGTALPDPALSRQLPALHWGKQIFSNKSSPSIQDCTLYLYLVIPSWYFQYSTQFCWFIIGTSKSILNIFSCPCAAGVGKLRSWDLGPIQRLGNTQE